jgi:ribosomal protein S18 acetylase RimI-like enzyme
VIVTRPIRLPADATAVEALDFSFTTTTGYQLRRDAADSGGDQRLARIELVGPVDIPPRTKRYELRPLEGGIVARRDGVIVGYAHVAYAEWNRRAELDKLYVAAGARRAGVGSALIAAAFRHARQTPARCLWLETQDINGPAVSFYVRHGFTLCGFDDSLYDPVTHPGEIALYFSQPL